MRWYIIRKYSNVNYIYGSEFMKLNEFVSYSYRFGSLENMSMIQILEGNRAIPKRHGFLQSDADFSDEFNFYHWVDERFVLRTQGKRDGIARNNRPEKVCFCCVFHKIISEEERKGWTEDKKKLQELGLSYEFYEVKLFKTKYKVLIIHLPNIEIQVPEYYRKVEETECV